MKLQMLSWKHSKLTLKREEKSLRHCLKDLKPYWKVLIFQLLKSGKEAFDFGRFLSAAENGRTGKYDAEKLMKYMEDKFKAKDALIDKLQLKNVSLKT